MWLYTCGDWFGTRETPGVHDHRYKDVQKSAEVFAHYGSFAEGLQLIRAYQNLLNGRYGRASQVEYSLLYATEVPDVAFELLDNLGVHNIRFAHDGLAAELAAESTAKAAGT